MRGVERLREEESKGKFECVGSEGGRGEDGL